MTDSFFLMWCSFSRSLTVHHIDWDAAKQHDHPE